MAGKDQYPSKRAGRRVTRCETRPASGSGPPRTPEADITLPVLRYSQRLGLRIPQFRRAGYSRLLPLLRRAGHGCPVQAVCNACGLLPSLFYPCMKLVSKERAGSKYRKRRDAAKPPYRRLIEREDVPRDRKPAVIDLKTSASLMERKSLPDAAIDNLPAETFSAVT